MDGEERRSLSWSRLEPGSPHLVQFIRINIGGFECLRGGRLRPVFAGPVAVDELVKTGKSFAVSKVLYQARTERTGFVVGEITGPHVCGLSLFLGEDLISEVTLRG